MSDKQLVVFNSMVRYLLVSGPRATGKTRGCLHRIVRHLWEVDRARVMMFARTQKLAKDGGTWALLHRDILPEWIASGIGLRYTTFVDGVPGYKTDGNTRTLYFKIRNRYGTESEMFLFSLDDDNAVETKIKNLECSLFYVSELDNFSDRRMLTVPIASLRIGKFDEQQWIADCNPSEEGEQSWIYQTFYKERLMPIDEFNTSQKRNELPEMTQQEFRDFYGNMDVIEIVPKDNPFLDPRAFQAIRVACGNDAGLTARHVEGKWVWGGGDKSRHFRSSFKPHHCIGSASDPNEEEWETLVPSTTCWELVTGWDLGNTNHAAHIIEKSYPSTELTQKLKMRLPYFAVLDELVMVGKEISHEEFAQELLAMIVRLETLCGHQFDLTGAWSDQSSITTYNSVADTYPHLLVMGATEERIILQGVPKARGSVRERVRLIKQLLNQDRLVVSAHCFKTIQMFKDLKKGEDEINYVVSDKNKHPFDSLSYPILMECAEEVRMNPSTPQYVKRSLGHVQIS